MVGRQARTTVVPAAAVPVRAGQVAFPCPGGDAFCVALVDRRLAAMQAAGAEDRSSDGRSALRFVLGEEVIRAS
ncbi:hypothetical protein [Streptomyces tendae]|uniref:hypothetical protein n=1 Tax=Streptomyces tendae TaxID=1932 RepID=UPI00369F17B7